MNPRLRSVSALPPASLELVYEGGQKRRFDLSMIPPLGLFADLADPALFSTVHLSYDSVEWANGADIDPERLYEDSRPIDLGSDPRET
jgi:hypothetical protein